MSLNSESFSSDSKEDEEAIQSRLNEVEFSELLKAENKLEKNFKRKKEVENLLQRKKDIEKRNKKKGKVFPKEFSAVIKPKERKINIPKKNHFIRDPRFDDLSGSLNKNSFEKNYLFVKDLANEYANKLKEIKLKNRKNLNQETYSIIQKQTNNIKSWLNKQKQSDIKKELNREIQSENKNRGKKNDEKIFLKKSQKEKIFKTLLYNSKTEEEKKKYEKKNSSKKFRKLKNIEKNENPAKIN